MNDAIAVLRTMSDDVTKVVTNCHNCGAPLTPKDKCEYCDSYTVKALAAIAERVGLTPSFVSSGPPGMTLNSGGVFLRCL